MYHPFRFKFDDERVTKEDLKKALEEQYGGEEEVYVANHNVLSAAFACDVCIEELWSSMV